MAFETRYEVRTQVLSSTPAERLPAMCGKATLATLVSSTSMKVASITVRAITHGFVTPPCRARANKLLIRSLRAACGRWYVVGGEKPPPHLPPTTYRFSPTYHLLPTT